MFSDVACRTLGYTQGISHCCEAFGFSHEEPLFKDFECSGSEKTIFGCEHYEATEYPAGFCPRQDYVSLTCFNGSRTNSKYNYHINVYDNMISKHV